MGIRASDNALSLTLLATGAIMSAPVYTMRSKRAPSDRAKAFRLGFSAILLSCLAFIGCENFCVNGVANAGVGIAAGTGGSCPAPKQTGNIALQFDSSLTPDTSPWPSDVQHIFVSLRGIEALPTHSAGDDPPAWQELAPDLVTQPTQVDLIARADHSCRPSAFSDAVVDAGVYSQVRLSLIPNEPEASRPVPAENACGSIGFNCIIATNGTVRPLVSDNPNQLDILPEGIAGGFFRVLPDEHIRLTVEFEPQASLIQSAGEAVRLVPAFYVTQQSLCESDR